MRAFFALFLVALAPAAAFADSTFLAERTIAIQSTRSAEVLDRTLADVRMVFQKFELALDSGSKIVTPKKVTGTPTNPVMTVSVRKCVVFICQTMDLDAEIDVRETRGACDRDFQITADLRRSSREVRDVYDRLELTACYKKLANGKGSLKIAGHAHHGPAYNTGIVQNELFKMLQLQVPPLVTALQATLKAKE